MTRIVIALAALLLAVPALGQHASEDTIARDCKADALSLCFSEAMAIGVLGKTPARRAAIIRCMVKNKKSLSAQCARHLH